jgi:hypothetical protein
MVAAWEVSMVGLRDTINPEHKGQIDAIGWLFAAFVVVVTGIAATGVMLLQ